MSTAALVIVVAVALAGLAAVLNQVMARLALVEVALTEGLPPGHGVATEAPAATNAIEPGAALGRGVHVFLSRSCHACQRLVDELGHRRPGIDAALTLRYVDRPRPLARDLADQLHAALHTDERELAHAVGADPLPYTIAVGDHGLVDRSVSPTVHDIATTARNAGIGSPEQP